MPPLDENASIRELAYAFTGLQSTMTDFRNEMRGRLMDVVKSDVYAEARASDRLRIQNLEDALKRSEEDKATGRRLAYLAVFGAVLSLIVSFISATHGS